MDDSDDDAGLKAMLGESFFTLCDALGRAKGVHATAVYPLLMSVISTLVGHKIKIIANKGNGYPIRFVMWNILMNFSGCGKSPVVDMLTRAIHYVDVDVRQRMLAALDAEFKEQQEAHQDASQQADGGDNSVVRTSTRATAVAAATERTAANKRAMDEYNRRKLVIQQFTFLNASVTMEATHLTLFYQEASTGLAVKVYILCRLPRAASIRRGSTIIHSRVL
jgi:hypothetical protein